MPPSGDFRETMKERAGRYPAFRAELSDFHAVPMTSVFAGRADATGRTRKLLMVHHG